MGGLCGTINIIFLGTSQERKERREEDPDPSPAEEKISQKRGRRSLKSRERMVGDGSQ